MKTHLSAILITISLFIFSEITAQRNDSRSNYPNNSGEDTRRSNEKDFHCQKEDLIMRIKDLERNYSYKLRPREKEEFQRELRHIIRMIDKLAPDEHEEIIDIYPISEIDLRELMSSISKEPFDKSKTQILATSAQYNFFLIDQVVKIVNLYTFDKDKVAALKILYPKILNPEKNYLLYNCLTFSSAKEELENYIASFERDRKVRETLPAEKPGERRPH